MQGIVIELADIAKSYGRRQLFGNLSRRIGPGEALAVTGPNGSGKSTLVKMIAGLVRPSSGTVKLYSCGQELAANKRRACLGLVSPEITLYNAMTGYENLQFLLSARGVMLPDGRLLDSLKAVGLDGCRHDVVAAYSTGMRQRLKFAIMDALKPRVWLLDEPSSNLDEAGRKLVRQLMVNALAQQATVIIATNDLEEASYAGQRIALV
jgi:ABC-type multidrug transport system ATPase subunit